MMIPSSMPSLVEGLVRVSIQVSVLVVCVLIVQRLLARQLSPRWRYALWSVVLLRLALPVQFESDGAVWSWEITANETPVASEPTLLDEVSELRASEPGASQGAVSPVPRMHVSLRRTGERSVSGKASDLASKNDEPSASEATDGSEVAAAKRAEEPRRRSNPAHRVDPQAFGPVVSTPAGIPPGSPPEDSGPWSYILLLWALGGLVLFGRALAQEWLFRRDLRHARRVGDEALLELVREACGAMGLRRMPLILETTAVSSPAVVGVFRPRLLLPERLVPDLHPLELRQLVLHELAHVRSGDVALNALLVIVRCVYWFHPLVHLALYRLRADQESARDFDALSADASARPIVYARTLVKVLERLPSRPDPSPVVSFLRPGRSLRKRMLMIANFESLPRQGRFVGLFLVTALSWVAFTSRTPSVEPGTSAVSNGGQQRETPRGVQESRRVSVERPEADPQWKVELEAALGRPTTLKVEGEVPEAVDALREATGLNFYLDPEWDEHCSDLILSIDISEAPLEQLLSIIRRMTGGHVSWCIAREAICMGDPDSLPNRFDLRLYDMGPLFEGMHGDELEDMREHLSDLIREIVDRDSWDEYSEASIRIWNNIFVITQMERVHSEVEAFVNLILNGGKSEDRQPEWHSRLVARLAESNASAAYLPGTEVGTIIDALSELLGFPIVYDYSESLAPLEARIQLSNVTYGTILEWLSDIIGTPYYLEDGAIVFSDDPRLDTRLYEARDLLEDLDYEDLEEAHDALQELLRDNVAPDSWNEDYVQIQQWRDTMVVYQTRDVHQHIENFLGALRRASGR